MLHLTYMRPGAQVDLPEVAVKLGVTSQRFTVISVHPGGMGVCVRLQHENAEGTFSLKCIKPALIGDHESSARFRDEIAVWLAASACNAVVDALAVVRVNETPAIVARWLDAGDLSRALPLLKPEARFELALRVCRALGWVYRTMGVVHRDIKPGNILLDHDLLAYVSDWGLARPVRNAITASAREAYRGPLERNAHTQRGSFLGTVLYAAPEQFTNASSVDHRADIYALGCIMFEMEAGHPPFVGPDFATIMQMHLHHAPPRLGKLLRRTKLGLERVVARCMAKRPDDRFQSYEELDAALLAVAASRGFSTERCKIQLRRTVHRLGDTPRALEEAVENAPGKGHGVAVIEQASLDSFVRAASDLIALERYAEAEVLLRPTYVPELCSAAVEWTRYHSLAIQYALCLQHIGSRLQEALDIFSSLELVPIPPPEYTVNYSLALIHNAQYAKATAVCERALARYPDDVDILGNYTIALKCSGELERARGIAERRLKIRRDVHSLSEAAGVLEASRDRTRNTDLPRAVATAELEGKLITEGLSLNPSFGLLRLQRIRLMRFAHAPIEAMEACNALVQESGVSVIHRQTAMAECIDIAACGGDHEVALQLLAKVDTSRVDPGVAMRVKIARMRVLTDMMVGRTDDKGRRLVIDEARNYVLSHPPAPPRDTVVRARVLEWIGRHDDAETVLQQALLDTDLSEYEWVVRRQLVRLLLSVGRVEAAQAEVRRLKECGPWRAGTFDELHDVEVAAGNHEAAGLAKRMAERIYQSELQLFTKLRAAIL